MSNQNIKILVSSVDPWCESVGSDTLSSLLSHYDSSQVASINIRARLSDSKVAGRYFHIVESRVIKSIYSPCIEVGDEYCATENQSEFENNELERENKLYSRRFKINRWFLVIAREIIWKLGRWKSRKLDQFVETFSPDILFFPIEGYIHFNRINSYLIKKHKFKRIVGYMWDDNFTFKQCPSNPLYLLHRIWLRRSVKRLINKCDVVFAISPKMKRELDSAYGINSILLTKPLRTTIAPSVFTDRRPIRLIYTGKLGIGRDETIVELVKAIKKVNKHDTRIVLDLYTNTVLDPNIKSIIDSPGNCNLRGFIPQHQVFIEQQKADILLFVESLSTEDLSARLSFSTKITDYLSSGKCIWAIGNKCLAPMDYFIEKDSAIVSSSKEEIHSHLDSIINESSIINEYAQKAYDCGMSNHSKDEIIARFKEAIEMVVTH